MYSGFLLKFGTFNFPLQLILAESVQIKLNTLDMTAERAGGGVLIRDALEHKPLSVKFTTVEGLSNTVVEAIMANIRSQYINEIERKVLVTVYVPELGDYITQEMYLADPAFIILELSDSVIYDGITFELTGY